MDERARWEERLRKEGLYLKQHRREVQAFPWVLDKAVYPEGDSEDRREKKVEIPLEVLSPMQKEVVYCLFYDMRSLSETARHLGISKSSVKVHKKRALEKLKATLKVADK
ncbi:MAG: hypothetical protein J7J32_00305 [Candidatus Atribacteria bacterium]|nr:hypothetical protein [Candidatus Atribacteria bacterium]MCD6349650.1 hypothetical protein [Candidatus Atribacteria bacterium]